MPVQHTLTSDLIEELFAGGVGLDGKLQLRSMVVTRTFTGFGMVAHARTHTLSACSTVGKRRGRVGTYTRHSLAGHRPPNLKQQSRVESLHGKYVYGTYQHMVPTVIL